MALTPPPPIPQRGDRSTFSDRVDAFLTWLATFVSQINTLISSLGALAAGGAYALPYVLLDNVTAQSDPGVGYSRFNNTMQGSSTQIYIDYFGSDGKNYQSIIASFAGSTSAVIGSLRITSVKDASRFVLFDLNSIVDSNGYYTLNVTPRGGGGTFTVMDSLLIYFQRTGDKGDPGAVSGMPSRDQLLSTIDTVPVANGGTGAKNAADARTNLGAKSSGVEPIATGGTGATTAAGALNNLGGFSKAGGTLTGNLTFANNTGLFFNDTGGTPHQTLVYSSDNNLYMNMPVGGYWNFYSVQGSQIARLDNNGTLSAVTITQTSDERKKQEWAPLTAVQLAALANMEHVGTFAWKDGSGRSVGGSAQEIRRIVPEAVHEDAEGNLTVQYGGLNFAILQAVLREGSKT